MEIKNINTLVADICDEVDQHRKFSKEIGHTTPQDSHYSILLQGVRLLQDRFLRAMDTGELDYKKINRD